MRALLLALALASCTPLGARQPTPGSAADATYKIAVTLKLELPAGQATLDYEGWGTAWRAGTIAGDPAVITAGHVCPVVETVAGIPMRVVAATYELSDQEGLTFPAQLVARESDPDLCLLSAPGIHPAVLFLAPDDPDYGEPVTYVGAADGVYGDGAAPFYTGHYAGSNLITAPSAPGASGSAVWDSQGVIGVLVASERAFNGETFIETRGNLKRFLEQNGVVPYINHFGP